MYGYGIVETFLPESFVNGSRIFMMVFKNFLEYSLPIYRCVFYFFVIILFTLKRSGQEQTKTGQIKKFPLFVRSWTEDSRRNRGRGWRLKLVWKVSWHSSFERVRVIGRWKNRQRKRVPEFTSVKDERMKILVNSCIRKVDRIGMRRSRKPCAARLRERWRHVVTKFRRAFSMKIVVEDG